MNCDGNEMHVLSRTSDVSMKNMKKSQYYGGEKR